MIGQNWRYERMTRGRRREHYQWNVELVGEPSVTAEAELISAIFCLLDAIGLPRGTVSMRINSRALLEESLRQGVLASRPELFEPLCVVIDKLDKIGADKVIEQLCAADGPVGLSRDEAQRAVSMLEARSLDEAAQFVAADSPALAELKRLFALLEVYGVADQCRFDASVVRGLAYYTGVVFEAFDSERTLRAICGGGRYDRLIETLGGPATPAVGFGFGDAVVAELLADQKLLPELPRQLDDLVFARSEDERPAAIRVAGELRSQGRRVELLLGTPSMKRAMKDADRSGAARVWLIGADEVARGTATVRELATGEQREEPLPG
jgi:histidyl-tRNA synthetase